MNYHAHGQTKENKTIIYYNEEFEQGLQRETTYRLTSYVLIKTYLILHVIQAEDINNAGCQIAREVANEGDALVAGGVSYTMAYKTGRGKHAVQEQYMKQAQVLVDNVVDFLIGEVLLCYG